MVITIIIATYNSDKTLRQCLESIKYQDSISIEVIIKDGSSSDDTLEIIKEFDGLINFKYISSVDTGVYDAWNTALKISSGDWVTFLGSDDYLSSNNALMSIVPYLIDADNTGIELIYGMNDIIDIDGNYIKKLGVNWNIAKKTINKEMSIRHPGCFCKKSLITKMGGFDTTFNIIGDYDFILRSLNYTDFGFYPFSIVKHRLGGLSISPKRNLSVIKETFKLRKKNDLVPTYLFNKLFFKRFILYILSVFISDELILKLVKKVNIF